MKPTVTPQKAVLEYAAPRKPTPKPSPAKPRKSGGASGGWIIALIVIGIVRACTSEQHRQPYTPPLAPYNPSYRAPTYPYNTQPPLRSTPTHRP